MIMEDLIVKNRLNDIADNKVAGINERVIRINGTDWYKCSFTLLCICFFFLAGLYSGLSISDGGTVIF